MSLLAKAGVAYWLILTAVLLAPNPFEAAGRHEPRVRKSYETSPVRPTARGEGSSPTEPVFIEGIEITERG